MEILMNEEDQIQILLKEYETLRTEIIRRIGHRFTFLGLSLALIGYGLFTSQHLTSHQVFLVVAIALVLFIVWYWIGGLIYECGLRVAEIESEINKLAGHCLLRWEQQKTTSGIMHLVYGRFRDRPKDKIA